MKISPLFTDLYQLTMAEAYLNANKEKSQAVFELFFRRCPFGGEYAIAAGYDLVREFVENFHFSDEDIRFLKDQPSFRKAPPRFFETLASLDLSDVEIEIAYSEKRDPAFRQILEL